mgnify:FL=1
MDASTPINRSGKVMVSIAGLRRLLTNSYQSEMVEEMLNDVIFDRLRESGYRMAGIAANCKEVSKGTVPDCGGMIYLDRERHCDSCGRQVFAPEVVEWFDEGVANGTIVKSFTNMNTEEFWNNMWEEFDRMENANAGELAKMVKE